MIAQASRARHGIDWYVSREDLGHNGADPDRIQRLADKLTRSTAKTASITHQPAPEPAPALDFTLEPDADLRLERIIAPHVEPDVGVDLDR